MMRRMKTETLTLLFKQSLLEQRRFGVLLLARLRSHGQALSQSAPVVVNRLKRSSVSLSSICFTQRRLPYIRRTRHEYAHVRVGQAYACFLQPRDTCRAHV